MFVYEAGSDDDLITDFDLMKDSFDLMATSTDFTGLSDVQAAASATGEGLLIDLGGGDSVILAGITVGDLASMDILY